MARLISSEPAGVEPHFLTKAQLIRELMEIAFDNALLYEELGKPEAAEMWFRSALKHEELFLKLEEEETE